MTLHYKTCRKIFIYLNKVKIAKSTLKELFLKTERSPIEQMARKRFEILKKFQLELISFLTRYQDQLPYNPADRCRATVYWFASQKLMETSDQEVFRLKMETADSLMCSECCHILVDERIPAQLRQILENHITRISSLKQADAFEKTPTYE